VRIIDPYRRQNERALRWLESRSLDEKLEMLEKIGILDKRGNLRPGYRAPKAPKAAKPKSTKVVSRKRAAS
jgi:hypothetical protein